MNRQQLEERVLLLAPHGRDAELTAAVLFKAGFTGTICATAAELIAELGRGAACAVLTQEALSVELHAELSRVLVHQPPWSDFPFIALVNAQVAESSRALADLGNVTVLERPLTPTVLFTAVNAALRGRQRQYAARAAIEQRDQFLAMLGHELRNPLGAIVLATQLARNTVDRAQVDARLTVIERQSTVLARLVDDLLDVARVTTGKVQLRCEAVDIDATIRSSISALADRAQKRGVPVTFASASGAIIEGDRVRIEQIINNLVSNAIKYSPAGRPVTVAAAIEGATCVIRVRDQGIGIAPDMQRRVFDLFAQVDGSLERADGGMGIGLTVVDRLVRLHGGRVELHSAGLGLGTELIVTLPIGSPPGSNVVKLDSARPAKLRVVLVEDNPDVRELTKELLETLGCTVDLAVDGQDGVARILASKPDLALVDIGLPIFDGYTVAQRVRAELGSSLMLVAASGYGLEQDRERSHRAGFDMHVVKPLDLAVVRSVLELADNERARCARASE